jgi:hypothetical protein
MTFGMPRTWLPRFLKPRQTSTSPTPASPSLPLGLNRDQVDSLRHLAATPQWRVYQRALERLFEINANAVLTHLTKPEQYAFQCGVCETLRLAADLPTFLTETVAANDRARPKPDPDDPARVFTNSPLWTSWSADRGQPR